MSASSDLAILRRLARRSHVAAPTIGTVRAMAPGEVRAHLSALESRRLVESRQDKGTVPPRRVFYVMAEGRRAVGIIDARSNADTPDLLHDAWRSPAPLDAPRGGAVLSRTQPLTIF